MSRYGMMTAHYVRIVLALLGAALVLELCAFNFNHWSTLHADRIDMASKLTLDRSRDATFKLTEANHVIEFTNINKEVTNLRIDFTDDQPAQNVQIKVQFTDDGHETYFDSTEFSAGVPRRTLATNNNGTEYVKLATTGKTKNLRIEVVNDDKITYPVKINTVYLNATMPFYFSPVRFILALGVLMLGYIFRPKSRVYRIHLTHHLKAIGIGIASATFVEIIVISIMLFTGSNMVGIATQSYNNGSWDRASIVTTFEVGGENSQQYAMLAESMAQGHLYLNVEPPAWLREMDNNPYDKGARDELEKATGQPYLWDTAYYKGHYYVYFGIVPEIVFYLPFYLMTGDGFPTAIGVWLAAVAFIIGCSALLYRFARYHFKRVSLGLYLLLQAPLVCCCGIVYLVKFPTFYSLPIMMALAFSVWGLYLWMRGRSAKRPCGWYLGGSLCMALVLGCRPQLVVLSVVALPLFWRRYLTEGRIKTKRGVVEFICLIAPYLVVGAGIMMYNYARFGSFFDFGSNYNLTTNDMTQRGWDVGRLAPALFAYFFQTPTTTGVFPYIQPVPFDTTYMGQTIKEATFGGIFACLPILWVLPFAMRAVKMRIGSRATHTIAGVIIVLLTGGIMVALLDAEMAGILQRYFADFSIMFLLVAVLTLFILNENIDHESSVYLIGMKVLPVLVALSIAYSCLLFFIAETGWYSEAYPWAYTALVHQYLFWA